MQRLRRAVVSIIIALPAFFFSLPAWADPMPDSATVELNKLLTDPRYQPRHPAPGWNFDIREILLTVWQHFSRWVREHLPSMPFHPPSLPFLQPLFDGLAFLGNALIAVFLFLWKFWFIVPSAILLWFAYKHLKRRVRFPLKSSAAQQNTDPAPETSWEQLRTLLERGDVDQMISMLRDWFRDVCRKSFRIPLDLTDRETVSRIPPSAADRECYRKIARIFERRKFASDIINQGELEDLLTEVHPLFLNPQQRGKNK